MAQSRETINKGKGTDKGHYINSYTMQENYNLLLKQAESLIASETDIVAVTANLSALLFNGLDRINWLGFYFLRDSELVLGPFQGNVACTRIPVGQGVCGTAFKNNKTLIVDDVHLFRGHIACDAASESVVALLVNAKT